MGKYVAFKQDPWRDKTNLQYPPLKSQSQLANNKITSLERKPLVSFQRMWSSGAGSENSIQHKTNRDSMFSSLKKLTLGLPLKVQSTKIPVCVSSSHGGIILAGLAFAAWLVTRRRAPTVHVPEANGADGSWLSGKITIHHVDVDRLQL